MGHPGRRLTVVQRLLFTDEPDIGVLQGVFTLLFMLDLTLRALGGTPYGIGSYPAAGLGLVLVTCMLAIAVPWHRLPSWTVGVLPVLDLAALGLSRMDADGGGAGILAVVPALWLGRQFSMRGAGVAVVAVILLIALPNVAYQGLSGVSASRALMIAVVAGWAALVIAYALDRLRASRDAAEAGRLELAAALETIENERRFSDAILDTVDVGLVLLAADGTYRRINRRHDDFMTLAFPRGTAAARASSARCTTSRAARC